MHKPIVFRALGYAFKAREAAASFTIGEVGSVTLWVVLWATDMTDTLIKHFPLNPFAQFFVQLLAVATMGVFIAFFLRFIYFLIVIAPFESSGGLRSVLSKRFGRQMWPIVLMSTGLLLFVFLFGLGSIWYVVNTTRSSSLPAVSTSATETNLGATAAKLLYLENQVKIFSELQIHYLEISSDVIFKYKANATVYDLFTPLDNLRKLTASMQTLARKDFGAGALPSQAYPVYDPRVPVPSDPFDRRIWDDRIMKDYESFKGASKDFSIMAIQIKQSYTDAIKKCEHDLGYDSYQTLN